jgi:hypothetical protein
MKATSIFPWKRESPPAGGFAISIADLRLGISPKSVVQGPKSEEWSRGTQVVLTRTRRAHVRTGALWRGNCWGRRYGKAQPFRKAGGRAENQLTELTKLGELEVCLGRENHPPAKAGPVTRYEGALKERTTPSAATADTPPSTKEGSRGFAIFDCGFAIGERVSRGDRVKFPDRPQRFRVLLDPAYPDQKDAKTLGLFFGVRNDGKASRFRTSVGQAPKIYRAFPPARP